MIFQPVLHPLLLVLLCAPVAGFVVWELVRPRRSAGGPATGSETSLSSGTSLGSGASSGSPTSPRWVWALRLLTVVVVFLLLLRPGIPGGTSQTLATDTDIVLLVDTTASSVAEDWNGDEPRLDGIRSDVQAIVDEYPGARFALITFDAAPQLRLPLTTDSTALISALDVLRPEVTDQSQGSSIGIANRMLADTLSAAAQAAPERSRMVFYLGDGEQTASSEPESFESSRKFVDGGGVFGYGTSEGGPMRKTTGTDAEGEYIQYQGAPAMSVIDEQNLEGIADQLGVDYSHRTADSAPSLPEAPTSTTDYASSGEVGNVIELYWILALVLIALIAVELARATLLVVRLRGLTAPASTPASAPPASAPPASASASAPNFGGMTPPRMNPAESSEISSNLRNSETARPAPEADPGQSGGDR